ncbi:DUF1799 domain-containing protein [Chitinilyticum aquatile]|uniref:DUF1799 domain-containing protein n=1 Tax=Chitinilyticum aquatile TaxID=362520 RepID=UPI0003FA38CF|nr:DUF1799 domain-containing protein [Chitinilyticum aquatile]
MQKKQGGIDHAAALGMPPELVAMLAAPPRDEPAEEIEVYPENWPALQVFLAMQTQWRVGMAGATGLDYTALPAVFELTGVKKRDRPDTFERLRVLEIETLRVWGEQAKQKT